MPDSTAGARRTFQFSATTVEGLREELQDYVDNQAKVVEAERIITKGVQFIPVDPTGWKKTDTPLGLMFMNKDRWDDFSGAEPWWVAPDSVYKKVFHWLSATWVTTRFDED